MRKVIFVLLGCCLALSVYAQNNIKIKIQDKVTHEGLPGASVSITNGPGGSTDSQGLLELSNLPNGPVEFKATFVGFRDTLVSITLPYEYPVLVIELEAVEETLEEVIISSTRNNRRIEDLPLKVEVLGLEEKAKRENHW